MNISSICPYYVEKVHMGFPDSHRTMDIHGPLKTTPAALVPLPIGPPLTKLKHMRRHHWTPKKPTSKRKKTAGNLEDYLVAHSS